MRRFFALFAIVSVLAGVQFSTATAAFAATEPLPEQPSRGMWVWHFEAYSTPAARTELINFCLKRGIRLLMVQVHYNNDGKKDVEPTAMLDPEAYGALIELAKEAGVQVEALEGDPKWALKAYREDWWRKFRIIMDWYDQQPPQRRFVGLHLDVEPYLLEDFDTPEKWPILELYLDYMEQVRIALLKRSPEVRLAADIPFWYDNFQQEDAYANHNVVEFKGVKKPASYHVQDICDYIGIMSYRQFALGENSITRLCEGELSYAEQIGKKIFAGVEMSPDQDPPSISFHGLKPGYFEDQLKQLNQLFGKRKGYAGVLIHYYNTYREFLEQD